VSVLALRVGPVSTRVPARALAVSIVAAVLVAVGIAWSISVGVFPIPFTDVVGELTGLRRSADSTFIIRRLRLPRALTAALVGGAFGMSGQVFQRMVRNPLASPDILGVSAGAAVGAVAWIVLRDGSGPTVTFVALAGSILTVLAIYLLALKKGMSSYRLVLIGIGVTAMLNAVVAYLLTRAELFDAQRATIWLTGSVNNRGWSHVRPLAAALAVLVPVTLVNARPLRALELGDDTARGLGVPGRSPLVLAVSAAALAAVATAAAGPVGFVALVSPQIARRLVGPGPAALVPAGLVGAAIVVYADTLSRLVFSPIELPVGVVTAAVGAPYLLWLLVRSNRIGSGG